MMEFFFKSILAFSLLITGCHAAPSSLDGKGLRISGNHRPPVRDSEILSYLEVTKNLKPERTLEFGENQYEEHFVVESWDYEEALSSLLSGNNSTVSENIFTSDGELQLQKRDILYSALCFDRGTMGYVQTIGQVLPVICDGFFFSVGYAGRTQIVRRYGLDDVNNNRMVLVVRWTWHGAAYASANACVNTLTYYIGEYCENYENNQQVTQGGTVRSEQTDGCESSPCPVRADAGIDPQHA